MQQVVVLSGNTCSYGLVVLSVCFTYTVPENRRTKLVSG